MPARHKADDESAISAGPAFPLPHPGEYVLHDCLEPLNISVPQGARALGVTKAALYNIVKGQSGVSPDMAVRLSQVFGSTAEAWLAIQSAYDLARVRGRGDIQLKRLGTVA